MPTWSIKNYIRTPLLLLAGAESFILFASVYLSGLFVYGAMGDAEPVPDDLVTRAAVVASVILVSLISMGLYQFHQRVYFREVVIRVLVGVLAGTVALAAIYYAVPSIMLSRNVALGALAFALICLILLRYFFISHVDENIFRRRTLIYGAGSRANAITDLRRRADRRGFKIVGKVAAPGDTQGPGKDVYQTNGKSISDLALEHRADEIVVAMDDRRGNLPIRELLDCKLRGIDVIDLLEFLERETGKIRIDLVNPSWLIFSPGFRTTRFRRALKRGMDVGVSVTLLATLWPLMLLIGLAIKWEDGLGAPVFYRQRRVGRFGDLFDVLKFRSMQVDAEADGQAVWASANDSRATRVGACLRKWRLDELPQAVNVLRGQMSLVGPRPERPEFVDELIKTVPYYAERHTVKPGVTGWAQIRYTYGASEEDAIEKLQYELYYVKNQNLMLDMLIILQTVEVVLWGKGAR